MSLWTSNLRVWTRSWRSGQSGRDKESISFGASRTRGRASATGAAILLHGVLRFEGSDQLRNLIGLRTIAEITYWAVALYVVDAAQKNRGRRMPVCSVVRMLFVDAEQYERLIAVNSKASVFQKLNDNAVRFLAAL